MIKKLFCTTATLLLTVGLGADTLWDRAVTAYGEHEGLVPGRMLIEFDQYNGRDKLVTSDESVVEIWVDVSGEIQSRVVYATRNGEDVTAERRDDPQSGAPPFGGGPGTDDDGDGGAFSGLQLSPFAPAEQLNVDVGPAGATEYLGSVLARRYPFTHRTGDDSANVGTAWLDVETGDPVRLELTIEPLPGIVDEFIMVQHFERDPEGRLVVRELEFDGAGHVLFLRRRIESRLIFSEYFRFE